MPRGPSPDGSGIDFVYGKRFEPMDVALDRLTVRRKRRRHATYAAGQWFFAVCLAVCLVRPVFVTQREHEQAPITPEELQKRIQFVLEETGTPGMIGAVVSRNEVLWAGAVGVADRTTGRVADAATPFRLGSLGKSFVAVAVMILTERGQLTLDAPINSLVPEAGVVNAWADVEPVRIEHLLEHTAGFDDIHPRDYAHRDPDITLLEGIQFNTTSRTVRWRPGTRMSYSNVGPAVAALAVEKVTGKRFEDFVAKEIFAPLRMKSASFFFDDRVAKSYTPGGLEVPYAHIIFRPSGALSASAMDMANFVRMLLNRGELDGLRIVEAASIERMETPSTSWAAEAGIRVGAGPGILVGESGGFRFYGHDGGIDGFTSVYGYLPADGLGYFYSVNSGNRKAVSSIGELLRGYVIRAAVPETRRQPIELSARELVSYVGYYELETPRNEFSRFIDRIRGIVSVTADGNALSIGSPLASRIVRLLPLAPNRFREEEASEATTVFVQEGEEWYVQRPDGTFNGTFRRISAWSAWSRWLLTALAALVMLSAPLFATIWVPRLVWSRLNGTPHLGMRLFPLAAVACLPAGLALLSGAGLEAVGAFTIWSVGLTALTWLFAVLTLLGAWEVWKAKDSSNHRGVWWHATLVSAANLLALSYLGYWGIIGMRPWAY